MLYISKATGRGNEVARKKNGHLQAVRESKLTKDSIPNKCYNTHTHACTCMHTQNMSAQTFLRICTHGIFKVTGLKHVKDNVLFIFH